MALRIIVNFAVFVAAFNPGHYSYFSEENACFINSESLTACQKQTRQSSNQNFPTPFFRERCQEEIAMLIAFSRSNPTGNVFD